MTRDWDGQPYARIYSTVPMDPKLGPIYNDDRLLAAYVRLLLAADLSWPMPPAVPRWLADDVLERLVADRVIELIGDAYQIVGLQAERNARESGRQIGGKARARNAARDPGGRFQPSQLPSVAGPDAGVAGVAGRDAGGLLDQQRAAPASQLDETRRDETSRESAREADPMRRVMVALSAHGVSVRTGSGHAEVLAMAIGEHGVEGVLAEIEARIASGFRRGDSKGLVFGTIDALSARARPPTGELEARQRHARSLEATQQRLTELKAGAADGGASLRERVGWEGAAP